MAPFAHRIKIDAAQRFGSVLSGIEHIPYPYAYRCAHGHTAETCGAEILEQLEGQIFKRLFDPEDIAGIIIEPIQGEGGYVPAPKFFLQELQRICRQHGIMSSWTKCSRHGPHRQMVGLRTRRD